MKHILITILLLFAIVTAFAAPSVVVNSGSIVVIEEASVIINNGILVINQTDGFYSDNVDAVPPSTPVDIFGPEGINDAITINATGDMGQVQIVNYSGMIYPGSTTTINHWWQMTPETEQPCTVTFRMRNGDLAGFSDLSLLFPIEYIVGVWRRMTSTTPSYSSANGFTAITFTGITWAAKKGPHDVTLGLSENETLPVELSSFTAILTSSNFVSINWVTQSESNLTGYYIYRGTNVDLTDAIRINALVSATNTSNENFYSFADREVSNNTTYWYWLQSNEISGNAHFFGPVSVNVQYNDGEVVPVIPLFTSIQNVFPNPSSSSSIIKYGLKNSSIIQIRIYNNRGQIVKQTGQISKTAGTYTYNWNGCDDNGKTCSTGTYIVRMQTNGKTFEKKLVLIK